MLEYRVFLKGAVPASIDTYPDLGIEVLHRIS